MGDKQRAEPQWRASDFMVCTRHEMLLRHFKLFCSFGLNCLLAGRSDACGVCVCVWNYRRFASLALTAFWRGGPMH